MIKLHTDVSHDRDKSNLHLKEAHEETTICILSPNLPLNHEESTVGSEVKDEIIEMQPIKRNAANRRRSRNPSTSSSHTFTVSILCQSYKIYDSLLYLDEINNKG